MSPRHAAPERALVAAVQAEYGPDLVACLVDTTYRGVHDLQRTRSRD